MLVGLICYFTISTILGFIACLVCDPYGHHSDEEPWYTIKQVVPLFLFWPIYILIIVVTWIYYGTLRR